MSTTTRSSSFRFVAAGPTLVAGPFLAAGVVIALVAALLAGCQQGTAGPASPSATPAPGASTSPAAPAPSSSATPTSGASAPVTAADVPVYFMVDARTGPRLIPERHDLTGEPVRSAVERMIAGPDDPDYTSPWNRATTVLGVRVGNPTVVDLSADARTASVGSAGAALMVQQLVHTVTAATGDPSGSVLLTIAGQPAGELWGAVAWTSPQVRQPAIDVQAFVQIDTPRQGATTRSPVTVSGQAAVFEATLPWTVLSSTGTVVTSGVTNTAEGQTFAPYTFTVDLAPGTYTVVATEDDPSGGAAPGPRMSDSKVFTVH